MKLTVCVLLCVFTVMVQDAKKKPRILHSPPFFYKAETFVELSENDRVMYVSGLMDGFYASAFFGASEATVENLTSCTKEMDAKQVTAIITKYVKDHPETWHLPLSVEADNALNQACPGGLKVVD